MHNTTEASLRRLAVVLKDSNYAIAVPDLNGTREAWNKGAKKLYGYTEKEALQMNLADLMSGGRQKAMEHIKRVASGRRACKGAGIENLRFHDLRHDFASRMRQSGVDIHRIKELLGHKDLRMTMRYSHLSSENLRDAVNVLDAMESGYVPVTLEKEKSLAG